MIRRPFLLFNLVIGILISGLLWYIQSEQFAKAIKMVAARYIPRDSGIEADFSELSIKLFPPGISIKKPKLLLKENNIAKIPKGSSLNAERIDLTFLPFQALSGDIRIHEVAVVNGNIHFVADNPDFKKKTKPTKAQSTRIGIHWDELFQVKAEAISLQNVTLGVQFLGSGETIQGYAENVRLGQWSGHGGLGYSIDLNLKYINGTLLKSYSLPETIHQLAIKANVNAVGLQLETFKVRSPIGDVIVEGKLKGDLLKSRDLLVDGSITCQGELGYLKKAYPSFFPQSLALSGGVSYVGKFKGNLLKAMETFQVDGRLSLTQAAFQDWTFDLVQADASWAASGSGGEVSLKKAVIQSQIRERDLGTQTGNGGKIEIGPVKWTIGSTSRLQVPVKFEKAHIHWLGAPGIKKIYPLDFRLNGTTDLSVLLPEKKKPWEIQANLKNWVEKFQLDNQKLHKKKPQKVVFKIPRIGLNGRLLANPTGITLSNIEADLPRTKLKAHGKIDFKNGYDLFVEGAADLGDVGQIAEVGIQGQGSISSHIHGPASSVIVDIDTDFKNASYLNLALGDFQGRITWDDDPNHLLFTQVKAQRGSTQYQVNGILDLDKEDKVDLKVQVPKGRIEDFIQIFSHFTKNLSWFPHTLTGSLNGDIHVSGGISMSQLKVLSRVNGFNWEYWGERFKTVQLSGGYDCGKYLISEFIGTKRFGKLKGDISYSKDDQIDWNLSGDGLTLSDLDHIAQLDVPIRGKVYFESAGSGRMGSIQSETEVSLNEFAVRGVGMAPSQLQLKTHKGVVTAMGTALGKQGQIDLRYNFDPKELSYVRSELKRFDFSPILLLLNTKSIQDQNLAGIVSGKIDLNFHAGKSERANGSLSLTEYNLSRSNVKFSLENPVLAQVNDGSFDIRNFIIRGKAGSVSLALNSQNGRLDGSLQGNLDNSIVEFLTSSVTQAFGTSSLDIRIGGAMKEPLVSGQAELGGGSFRVSSVDSTFENVSGSLQLKQNVVSVQNFQADLGGGRVSANGKILINSDRSPTVNLKILLNGPKIKVYPFQYAKVNGSLDVHGEEIPYLVEGNVVIASALSKEKVLNQKKSVAGLKSLQYSPPPTKSGDVGSYPKFRLNIGVEAPRDILIQNDLFRDVQAKGSFTIVNTLETPRILGKAEVIQGQLLFKDHVFQIQSATANFDNPTVINPSFNLSASTEVNGIKIQMFASGRVESNRMKIELTSNPAMQEQEILSLLAVGLTSSDAKKLNANDLSTLQQGEAASLVLHSLDFNRELEDKTGFQVQLDESINRYQGVSAFRPQSQADTAAAPQITIRRKLGERFSLSAGSTVGAGTNKANQINLDMSVSPDVSVTGVFNNYGTYGASETQPVQNSLGVDLKFQKRFK